MFLFGAGTRKWTGHSSMWFGVLCGLKLLLVVWGSTYTDVTLQDSAVGMYFMTTVMTPVTPGLRSLSPC